MMTLQCAIACIVGIDKCNPDLGDCHFLELSLAFVLLNPAFARLSFARGHI